MIPSGFVAAADTSFNGSITQDPQKEKEGIFFGSLV